MDRVLEVMALPIVNMTQYNTWWASLCWFSDVSLDFRCTNSHLPIIKTRYFFLYSLRSTHNLTKSTHLRSQCIMALIMRTMLCFMPQRPLVHGLYVGECSLGSRNMEFKGMCPWAPTLCASVLKFHNALSQGIPLCRKIFLSSKSE